MNLTSLLRNKSILALIILSISLCSKVTAQKIITDRPDQAESPVTVPKTSLQIEGGFQLKHYNADNLSVREIQMPGILLRYGLFKNIEIRVADQFQNLRTSGPSGSKYGLTDLELGTKIQILNNENINTKIAFLSHLIIACGSEGFSEEKYGSANTFAFSDNLTDHLDIGYNIGYNYYGTGNGDLTWAVSLGIGLSEKTGAFIETYGDLNEFKDPFINFDSGISYLIRDNLQLDCSFGIGLNNKMNFLSFGCSWNINTIKSNLNESPTLWTDNILHSYSK
jgi:hypothetical protein